ncbi:sensor histidine kinase [Verrucomicrobium spinosum]|uniref:sensor histidine kinase n=1 Tax=Verrucomicrobium spinosum TaxID=2736 RepID=UPI0002D69429|nr:ATP-binding protein [Verrucomicrobium spinosum]
MAALGAGAIAGYLVHRDRRKRFEIALEGRLRTEKFISELSVSLINVSADQIDQEVIRALERIQSVMSIEHCVLFTYSLRAEALVITHEADDPPRPPLSQINGSKFPWVLSHLTEKGTVRLNDTSQDLPLDALAERAACIELGVRSALIIPLRMTDAEVRGVAYATTRDARQWSDDLASSLQLIGDVLLSSLSAKQAETALRHTETSMTLAAESAMLGFWRWYPDENRSWLTDQARAIYGFEKDTRGTHADYLKRIHPEDRAAALTRFARAIKVDENFEHEYRLLFPDDDIRWVVVRARLVRKPNGRLQEIVGVSIDVTKDREQELRMHRQHEEMARLGRVAVLGEMTASLAHELNQPLTAIVTNASAARRFMNRDNPDPEMMNDLLQDITTAGQRAGEIIRGIRSMVKPGGAGREALDVNSLISEVLSLMKTDIMAKSSSVDLDLAPQLPQVHAIAVQVQQVLMNLLMNALEAMQHLPATSRRLTVSSSSPSGEAVHISVRDLGTGLPTDVPTRRLFDQFFSTKPDGMGMGLAIARSIVEGHGGTLEASDHPEGGAKFTIILPVRKFAPPSSRPA